VDGEAAVRSGGGDGGRQWLMTALVDGGGRLQ